MNMILKFNALSNNNKIIIYALEKLTEVIPVATQV